MAALTALEIGEHELCGIHFRITTAGGTSKANCHPFPLSQVTGDLKNICLETDAAMMHNGIFGPVFQHFQVEFHTNDKHEKYQSYLA